jgi:hypothetical protein
LRYFNRALTAEEVKSVFDSNVGLQAQQNSPIRTHSPGEIFYRPLFLAVYLQSCCFRRGLTHSKDKEISFKLKIASASVNELGDITVLNYTTYGNSFTDLDIIFAQSYIPVVTDDVRYMEVPILADVNTGRFDSTGNPNDYFTKIEGN